MINVMERGGRTDHHSATAPSSTLAIEVCDVHKTYRQDVRALDGLTFSVKAGTIFGLLGPNGAGKSTAVKVMTTLSRPDSGEVRLYGVDVLALPNEVRKVVGCVAQHSWIDGGSTGREKLIIEGRQFGLGGRSLKLRVTELLERFDLAEVADRVCSTYSGGMQRKLDLAMGLIHQPYILFLDEPTTGVDAVSRKEFWEMLKMLRQENITIIVSTPYMDEARQCDRVALMQEGRILKVDTPVGIVGSYSRPLLGIKSANRFRLIRTLQRYPYTQSAHPFGEYIHYSDQRSTPNIAELKDFLHREGVTDAVIRPVQPGIEDTFMDLMKG
jgi:ABC-2 type transport system ATP-binding protein